MPSQLFHSWLHQYQRQALALKERRLVVLVGDDNWALSLLHTQASFPTNSLSNKLGKEMEQNKRWLIYGDSAVIKANVQYKRYRDKLGSESDYVVFADSLFTIDAFASLSGTLISGGVFFLVISSEEFKISLKMNENDFFLSRFFKLIAQMPSSQIIQQQGDELFNYQLDEMSLNEDLVKNETHPDLPYQCATIEQLKAVQAIEKVAVGHRNRPLILTADRGRGKSSALAIACALLLQKHQEDSRNTNAFRVIITAPSIEAVNVFFNQLKQSLSNIKANAKYSKNKVELLNSSIEFFPIDRLIEYQPDANLVLVDEAAAIPVYLLVELLSHYHRLVFSSTVHGYEGAGRGFTLKFQQVLGKKYPQWQSLHINQPIRWQENDPLERLVFDSCLLNAELENILEINLNSKISALSCQLVSMQTLVENEKLLSDVFAVLVTAHYQTKPSNLKLLLNNKQVRLFCVFSENKVVAVALSMIEGKSKGIIEEDILTVKHAKRRLKNQFIPQSLLTHCGVEHAFNYQYLRVMRIAVHPQLQQQGIGTFLLKEIKGFAKKQDIDFIGSSFGVTSQLLSFWLSENYQVMRLGFTQDKASGEHSALVLNAITDKAIKLQKEINYQFYRSFDYLLMDEYKTLPINLVHLLQHHCVKEYLSPLTPFDINTVQSFAERERLFSHCIFSLHLWLKHQLKEYPVNQLSGFNLLIASIMQRRSTKDICKQFNLTGKKAMNEALREVIKTHLIQMKEI